MYAFTLTVFAFVSLHLLMVIKVANHTRTHSDSGDLSQSSADIVDGRQPKFHPHTAI
jgi:hypothetical protein